MTTPEFESMSEEEAAAWLLNNDTTGLMRQGARPTTRWAQADVDGEPMQSTAFRMPVVMLEELDQLAGRDREGRSGLVRQAVREFLDRRGQAAA